MQHPECREIGRPGAEVHPLSHDRTLCTHQAGPLDRAQSSLRLDGEHHRDGHLRTRAEFTPIEHQGPAGHDTQAQRLLHSPVRKVPRSSCLADLTHGAIRHVAFRRRGVRALLRLHRGREQSVVSGALRRVLPGRAREDARGGLPPHRGPGRPRDRLGPSPEGAHARQAVLHVLRSGRHPRTPPRPP